MLLTRSSRGHLDFILFSTSRHLYRSRLLPSLSSSAFLSTGRTTTTNTRCNSHHDRGRRIPITTISALVSKPSIFNYDCKSCFSTAPATTETNATSTIPFLLADIGEGIQEVEIVSWYCQPGDTIQQFDRVCEVQSDKATVEITSRYDGVVAALGANVGEIVKVGTPLMYFVSKNSRSKNEEQSTSVATAGKSKAIEAAASTPTTPFQQQQQLNLLKDDSSRLHIPTVATHYHSINTPQSAMSDSHELYPTDHMTRKKFYASPAVRKLGAEYGLDLSTIHGSGPAGRLLKIDVLTYLKEHHGIAVSPSLSKQDEKVVEDETGIGVSATTTTIPSQQQQVPLCDQAAVSTPSHPVQSPGQQQLREDYIIPIRGYNRHMISTMTASLQIPHMGFSDELIVDALQDFRKQQAQKQHVKNLSIVVCMVKALSLALTQHPVLNAVFRYDYENEMNSGSGNSVVAGSSPTSFEICCKAHHNIGIAMDTPRGLVVPVIKSVQDKTMLELQDELDRLKDAARNNKLSSHDVSDVTFTISNIGATGAGGTYMTPLLVPPQVAMGAFGSIQRVPRFDENDVVVPRNIMAVSWVADHRVLDGASLARFHGTFKDYIQNPINMLLHLK